MIKKHAHWYFIAAAIINYELDKATQNPPYHQYTAITFCKDDHREASVRHDKAIHLLWINIDVNVNVTYSVAHCN